MSVNALEIRGLKKSFKSFTLGPLDLTVPMGAIYGFVGPELHHSVWGHVSRLISFVKAFYPTWDDAYCSRLLEEFGIDPTARVMTLSFGTKIKLSLAAIPVFLLVGVAEGFTGKLSVDAMFWSHATIGASSLLIAAALTYRSITRSTSSAGVH